MTDSRSLDDLRFPQGCTCDPEAYESGPEGQRRYFEDRYCPIHGEAANAASSSLNDLPEPGTIWGGGGSTVRVLEVVRDGRIEDVRVERLVGSRGVLKRPSSPAVISLKDFRAYMHRLDLTKNDPWTRAIRERYA